MLPRAANTALASVVAAILTPVGCHRTPESHAIRDAMPVASESAPSPSPRSPAVAEKEERKPPVAAPSTMTYAKALATSRQAASDRGLRRVRSVSVEPGRASVEVYASEPDAADEVGLLHVIGDRNETWVKEGFSGTDVLDVVALREPAGTKLVSLSVTGCVGGFCPGGCGGGAETSVLSWANGRWSSVPELEGVSLTGYRDHDSDGKPEFTTTLGNVDLGGCDARWCCSLLGRFSIRGLMGWDGTTWTASLPRFRAYYVREREQNRQALNKLPPAGKSTREERCARLEAAARERMMARVACEDDRGAEEAFEHTTDGVNPIDCAPDEPDLPWASFVTTQADLANALGSAVVPRCCP